MRYKPEVKELIEWLAIDGNSTVKMAFYLGYKTSLTIDKWVSGNNIPIRQRERALKLIRSGK